MSMVEPYDARAQPKMAFVELEALEVKKRHPDMCGMGPQLSI